MGKYSLDLEKRDRDDVVREFAMLLIKLEAGLPLKMADGTDSPKNIVDEVKASRNEAIDSFVQYLLARKYN